MEIEFYLNERKRIVEEYELLIKKHQNAIETLLRNRNDELTSLETNAKNE